LILQSEEFLPVTLINDRPRSALAARALMPIDLTGLSIAHRQFPLKVTGIGCCL